MKKFENVYQDAALMRKVLLGEADEVEQKDLEKRLAECPDLRNVYEQLQSGETLKVAFGEYQKYSSKKAYQSFLQSIGQMESKGRKSRSRRVGWYAACSFFLYVELYLIGKRRENFDSAGNAAGTIDFVRWQRD